MMTKVQCCQQAARAVSSRCAPAHFVSALALLASGPSLAMTPPPILSEIRVDSLPPLANIEYIEIAGVAKCQLDGLSIVVIGDEDDVPGPSLGNSGVVESVTHLDGWTMPADRALLVHSSDMLLTLPDIVAPLGLEDSDNLTILLVRGCTCVVGDDLDRDDDGVLDAPPWTESIDSVAIAVATPGVGSEWVYSSTVVGPAGGWMIFHITRCLDTGEWRRGDFYFHNATEDTPGTTNPPCEGSLCTGDLDRDGSVGAQDLATVLAHWGEFGSVADVNDDGIVGAQDLSIVLTSWGDCDL
jgi:hypothetical protein